MLNLFTKKIFIVIIFFLVIFLLPQPVSAAGISPDAIATRVFPNPNNLSPLRWYQANIKKQGSPQALTVDGYEAIRDGRTVYVNAANISGSNFYTNIYLLSFNQNVEQSTEDIFSQFLAHWKFNTNVPAEQKDKIRNDTKRLADLAEIKSALNKYQKNHNGDFPSLAAGSYVAGKSISVWPSWQATLGAELGASMPLDPVNKLGVCPGYDALTCWDKTNKKFAGVPDNSHAYIYTYNGKGSYNICGLMESGYLTALQGACAGSAIGYAVDNCGSSAAGLSGYHREGNKCVSNKKINDPACYYQGTGYDYGWKNFARIWDSGSWQSFCVVYNCQDDFYFVNEAVDNNVKVAQGNCLKCSVTPPAVSVRVRTGCQSTSCVHPCEITACLSGQHPSSDGLSCENNICDAATLPASHAASCGIAASSNNQSYTNVTACGSGACTFICTDDYTGATCQIPTVYTCGGSIPVPPAQAESCNVAAAAQGQSYNHNEACNTSCSYKCVDGYTGNTCQTAPTYTCADTANTLQQPCGNGVATSPNQARVHDEACSNVCSYKCAGGYTGATCQIPPVYTCGGAAPSLLSYTESCNQAAAAQGQSYNHNEACNTPCSYKCDATHHWDSGACVANQQTFSCSTVTPANTVWNSNNQPTATANTALLNWVSSDWYPLNANISSYALTGSFCTYKCSTGYSWDGVSACVLKTSCLDLKNAGNNTNGQYKIDPDGAGGDAAFDVYCDMTTAGGGWTLIMKAVDANFAYADPLWEDSNTLNQDNFDFTISGGKSKYQSFNTVSFKEIRTSDTDNNFSQGF